MLVEPEEFLRRRKEDRPNYVFDLRDVEEFQQGNLAGSYNLPYSYFEANLHRMPFSGSILLYDGGEGIAEKCSEILGENGFTDVCYTNKSYGQLTELLETSPHRIVLETSAKDAPEQQKSIIQNLFDMEINPQVAAHGGYFELVDIRDNSVYVRLGGGCQGCGMADVTLRQGVEERLRQAFPDMKELIDLTDHDQGENPYYEAKP